MTNTRFFSNKGPFSLKYLAFLVDAEIVGDESFMAEDVATLEDAGPSHISFLSNKKYTSQFLETKAGACIVDEATARRAKSGANLRMCLPSILTLPT